MNETDRLEGLENKKREERLRCIMSLLLLGILPVTLIDPRCYNYSSKEVFEAILEINDTEGAIAT